MRMPFAAGATFGRAREQVGHHRVVPLATSFAVVAMFQFGLGLYASALNELFYARFGPFFDSMSYYNMLSEFQHAVREDGFVAAIRTVTARSTVVYPWLAFAPFADFVPMTRVIGVWIQMSASVAMHGLLFVYFYIYRGVPTVGALAYSAVFCVIAAAFFYNGGLSDFRMDYLQYLFMTATMAAYLIAIRSSGLVWWVVLGAMAALLCLARATSPVYLVMIFGILCLADLVAEPARWRGTAARWSVVAGVVAGLAGWHYIGNFDRLYYYYFIWNSDANARLPLSESARHIDMVVRHVGLPLGYGLAAICAVTLFLALAGKRNGPPGRFNWQPLVFSLVPVGYLVISGAGVNPFVSIVGVGGGVMFLLDPIDRGSDARSPPLVWVGAAVLLAVLSAQNAVRGIANHTRETLVGTDVPRQQGLRSLVAQILADADLSRREGPLAVATTYTGGVTSSTLHNVLVFDHGFRVVAPGTLDRNGLAVTAIFRGAFATEVEWEAQEGDTDEDKIANLLSSYAAEIDYIIVPSDSTKLPKHVYTTRFVPLVREALVSSPEWVAIGPEIEISRIESVTVLANRRRLKQHSRAF